MSNKKYYLWSAVGKFGTEVLSFLGNVLIARVLMPEDYGIVAMLSIFLYLSMNLSDAGFNDGLIRKKDCDMKDIGTIATYNMFASFVIYILMFCSAPYIAKYLGHQELEIIMRVIAISIILRSFTLSGFVQLNIKLDFKKSSIINICSSVCSILTVYIMALYGLRYWALVFQPISVAIYNILFLFLIARWRPYFCFYKDRFKELFAFSSNLLLSYIVGTIGNNMYGFIIGRFYQPASLGFYNQAHKMQLVPTQGINNVILTTSYPIIAKETDVDKRKKMYISLYKEYNFIMTFIVFLFISISDLVFLLVLGERWLPSSSLFSVFMLTSLAYPIMTINANIIKTQGFSNIYRNLSFLRTFLQITSLIICAQYSISLIVWGQFIVAFISVSFDMYFCGRKISFTILDQYKSWIKIVIVPFLSFVIAKFCSMYIFSIYISSIICSLIYIFTFCVISISVKSECFMFFLNKIKNIYKYAG